MDIDTYLALKAQESAEPPATPEPEVEETVEETVTEDATPVVETSETPSPARFVIDGEEVDEETLKEWKAGYSRTQDYTKKTQELARQRKEAEQALKFYETVKSNPIVAQEFLKSETIPDEAKKAFIGMTPEEQEKQRLTQELYDLRLERDVSKLQSQYPDFNVLEVLEASYRTGLPLEEAYFLSKGKRVNSAPPEPAKQEQEVPATVVDVNALREQLRAELEAELKGTQTIITSNGATPPTPKDKPTLTEQQRKVARAQGLSDEDYLKWSSNKTIFND